MKVEIINKAMLCWDDDNVSQSLYSNKSFIANE